MAQAINKKSGGGATFTEQDEKVYIICSSLCLFIVKQSGTATD